MPTIFTKEVIRKLDRLELVARKQLAGQLRAQRVVNRRGGTVEFADHRAYTPGDDLRYVDWNIYMREGGLFVKQYEAEEDIELLLLLDRSRSMHTRPDRDDRYPTKFEMARLLCGALGYVALSTLDAVRLAPFDGKGAARPSRVYRGKALAHSLLEELESMQPGSRPTAMAAAIEGALPSGRGRGVAVLASDLFAGESQIEAAVVRLRARRWQPFVLHIVDAAQRKPRLAGRMLFIDSETGRRKEVAVTSSLLAGYATFLDRREERLRDLCARHETAYVRVTTGQPFEQVILELLRRRGLVR